jgi:DNA invertase Pin-like site-specific DNA recombinase
VHEPEEKRGKPQGTGACHRYGRPMGRMVLTVLGMVAEMELGFIRDRQRAGIDAAKQRRLQGPPVTFDCARIAAALGKEGMGTTEIAKAVGCKRGNVLQGAQVRRAQLGWPSRVALRSRQNSVRR